jgi:plastocyanin
MAKLFLLLAASTLALPSVTFGRDVEVRIEGMQFVPATVEARVGDTIRWTNADIVPHTATRKGKASFDSGVLMPGGSFKKRISRAGKFSYGCSLHPTMKGTLILGR